ALAVKEHREKQARAAGAPGLDEAQERTPDWHPCRDVDGATCADQDECASGCIRVRPCGVKEAQRGR
ncbi:MAG TPA: hypothetical protein VGD21_12975, partial [Lysobacter sp.]